MIQTAHPSSPSAASPNPQVCLSTHYLSQKTLLKFRTLSHRARRAQNYSQCVCPWFNKDAARYNLPAPPFQTYELTNYLVAHQNDGGDPGSVLKQVRAMPRWRHIYSDKYILFSAHGNRARAHGGTGSGSELSFLPRQARIAFYHRYVCFSAIAIQSPTRSTQLNWRL